MNKYIFCLAVAVAASEKADAFLTEALAGIKNSFVVNGLV